MALMLVGGNRMMRGIGRGGDTADAQAFCPEIAEGRKLEIPTTTNNTLELLRQRGNACSASPTLHTSFEATPATHLQSSVPLHLQLCPRHYACSVSRLRTRLDASKPPSSRLRTRLHTSEPTYFHHILTSTRLQRISRTLEANSSTSLHLQHTSRAPELHAST